MSAISRPLTATPRLFVITKCWIRLNRFESWKKLPLNVNENCSGVGAGGPADFDPEAEDEDELDDDELDDDELEVGAGVDEDELPFAFVDRPRKSTFAPLEALWIS